MFSQEDIDAVLREAQEAVDSLAEDTGALVSGTETHPSGSGPAPPGSSGPASSSATTAVPVAAPPSNLQRLLSLRVPVVVRLAERTMRLSEVMKLAPGAIIEFDRTVDSPLDLMVNNRQIGGGVAVKAREHYGIRILRMGDMRHRINSLAGAS